MLGEGLTEEPLAFIWMLTKKRAVMTPKRIWNLIEKVMRIE